MWEVFTCGKMPYGRLKNTEVVERVQKGMILEKPKACYKEVYDVRCCVGVYNVNLIVFFVGYAKMLESPTGEPALVPHLKRTIN